MTVKTTEKVLMTNSSCRGLFLIDIIGHSVFGEATALLGIVTGIAPICIFLHQSLILSFIAVGLIAGPSGFDAVRSDAQIILEPFQDAADRAVENLSDSQEEERANIPANEPEKTIGNVEEKH
jgi:hypothetical protein